MVCTLTVATIGPPAALGRNGMRPLPPIKTSLMRNDDNDHIGADPSFRPSLYRKNSPQKPSRPRPSITPPRKPSTSDPLSVLPGSYVKTIKRVAVAIELITHRGRSHNCSRFCKTYPIFVSPRSDIHSSTPLPVYMGWLSLASRCSESCWVMAIILLSRIELALGQPVLCHATSNRLLLTALVVAAKCNEDYKSPFKLVSENGGTPARDLAACELTFLQILSFRVQVSHIDYIQCRRVLRFLGKKDHLKERGTPNSSGSEVVQKLNHAIYDMHGSPTR